MATRAEDGKGDVALPWLGATGKDDDVSIAKIDGGDGLSVFPGEPTPRGGGIRTLTAGLGYAEVDEGGAPAHFILLCRQRGRGVIGEDARIVIRAGLLGNAEFSPRDPHPRRDPASRVISPILQGFEGARTKKAVYRRRIVATPPQLGLEILDNIAHH